LGFACICGSDIAARCGCSCSCSCGLWPGSGPGGESKKHSQGGRGSWCSGGASGTSRWCSTTSNLFPVSLSQSCDAKNRISWQFCTRSTIGGSSQFKCYYPYLLALSNPKKSLPPLRHPPDKMCSSPNTK
jgi:hypothetical protein